MRNSPSTKIGTEQRDNILRMKEVLGKPSPIAYNPNDIFTKTHASAWGFGTG
jgi:hypothetical protein